MTNRIELACRLIRGPAFGRAEILELRKQPRPCDTWISDDFKDRADSVEHVRAEYRPGTPESQASKRASRSFLDLQTPEMSATPGPQETRPVAGGDS